MTVEQTNLNGTTQYQSNAVESTPGKAPAAPATALTVWQALSLALAANIEDHRDAQRGVVHILGKFNDLIQLGEFKLSQLTSELSGLMAAIEQQVAWIASSYSLQPGQIQELGPLAAAYLQGSGGSDAQLQEVGLSVKGLVAAISSNGYNPGLTQEQFKDLIIVVLGMTGLLGGPVVNHNFEDLQAKVANTPGFGGLLTLVGKLGGVIHDIMIERQIISRLESGSRDLVQAYQQAEKAHDETKRLLLEHLTYRANGSNLSSLSVEPRPLQV
jgi:hypothetical protein